MARSRTALAAGIAGCAAAVTLIVGVAGAQAQDDHAAQAILYLRAQQSPADGSIPSSPGSFASSELFAISVAVAGSNPNTTRAGSGPSVMTYLEKHARAACASAGPCGELIQAVVAARDNVGAFGGVNLVATLMRAYHTATGKFGDGEAFTEALAIQGLVAARAPVPPAATAYIVAAQNADGGWDYLNRANDLNPMDFATSDTNSTAMSLMALDAAGVHGRDASGLAWLRSQQDADGGFPYQAGAGSDPDSTALVVQAIVATGQSPGAGAWTKNGHTPVQELMDTQDPTGGYTFPGKAAPDAFTTAQVPPALLLRAFPAVAVPRAVTAKQPASGFPIAAAFAAAALVALAGGAFLLARRR